MRKRYSTEKPEISAKQKALDLLLYRTRTEKELYDMLTERGYSEEEASEALEYVRSYGYVNDEDYAKRYAASHAKSQGRYFMKRKLWEKGVPEELIDEALQELPEEEEETILELLERKYGEPHRLEEKEYRRMYGFLMRRGFGGSGIAKALRAYQTEEEYE